MTALAQSDTATGNKAILNYELGVRSCYRLYLRFGIVQLRIIMDVIRNFVPHELSEIIRKIDLLGRCSSMECLP